jgi:hypothetical protein
MAGTITTNVHNGRRWRGYQLQHVSTKIDTIDGHQKLSNLLLLFNKNASERVVLKYGISAEKIMSSKPKMPCGFFV